VLMFNRKLILVVLLSLFAGLASAQYFTGGGKPHAKVANWTRTPKVIIDTVKIVAGVGTLELSDRFQRGLHNVAGSSGKHIYAYITKVLTDTTATPYYYGYVPADDGTGITIISNGGTADTGLVSVQLFVK